MGNNNNDKEKKKKPGFFRRLGKGVRAVQLAGRSEEGREKVLAREQAERKARLEQAKRKGREKVTGQRGFSRRISIPKKKTPTSKRLSIGRTQPTKARIVRSGGREFIVVEDTPRRKSKKRRAAPKQKKTRVQLRRTPLPDVAGVRRDRNPFDFI